MNYAKVTIGSRSHKRRPGHDCLLSAMRILSGGN